MHSVALFAPAQGGKGAMAPRPHEGTAPHGATLFAQGHAAHHGTPPSPFTTAYRSPHILDGQE